MKRKKAVLSALLTAAALTGCLGKIGVLSTESSRIFVTGEGQLQTATVVNYTDQDYYQPEELTAYLEEAALAFNDEKGRQGVSLESCKLEKGAAVMIFNYGSGEDLALFTSQYEDKENQVDFISVTPVLGLLGQLEAEGAVFVKASDKKGADRAALAGKGDNLAVTVETQTPVTVQTQGKLLFVSENAEIKDRYTVSLPPGKSYIIFK